MNEIVLEAKMSELDKRLDADGKAINQLFTRVIALEAKHESELGDLADDMCRKIDALRADLAKQRAVNDALLSWFNDGEGTPIAALLKALK